MTMPLQAKMLRVLQQRECERVAGRKTIALDIRIVAATNRDLAAEVKLGAFREDPYHRLNVVSLRTSPLRALKASNCSPMLSLLEQRVLPGAMWKASPASL